MISERELREGLSHVIIGDGDGAIRSRLQYSLVAGPLDALKKPLQSVGRAVATGGRSLAVALDRWEALTAESLAGLRVATRGAAWLTQGFSEAKTRPENLSLRQAADSLASRKAELAALHSVNAAANSSLDERAILATVVQVVAEVTGAAVCSIYLLQPPNTLVLAATKGLNPEAVGRATLAMGEGVTGWAARERRTLAVADIWRDPRSKYLPETAEEAFHSMVSVPIVNRSLDRLLGVLNVQTVEARDFEEDEVNFLEMVCGELALAIENARSYELTDRQLHRKVEELTGLRRVIAMVASSLEFQRVLDSIAEGAVTLAGADASAIVVVDGNREEARVAACYGIAQGHGRTGGADEGPVGRALITGQPVVVADIAARRLGPGGDDVSLLLGHHSMFVVPFQGPHHARGALCLYARTYRTWMREEVDLVAAFANEAALALENAALYEEAQRGLATKSVLLSELHHRVKNNLQTVASLLSLGHRHASAPEARQVLEESRARIQSIAAVHELLSQDDVGLTTVGEVARKVSEIAEPQSAAPNRHVRIVATGERIPLATQQATTLAIVLNELLANALRHAFGGRNGGSVKITHRLIGHTVEVSVSDDGNGLPPDFDLERDKGLGLSIVETLTQQDLRGALQLCSNPRGGTTAVLTFVLP